MLILLLGIVFLHIAALVLLFVSTIVSVWTTAEDGTADLWKNCTLDAMGYVCSGASTGGRTAACFSTFSRQVLYLHVFHGLKSLVRKGQPDPASETFSCSPALLFYASSSGLFVMSGAIIYTVMSPGWVPKDNTFGYSYILAWVAFPLALISGLIYVILRKRE
ncbi:PREDICTED: peripheral myelin protein 22-like [Cyprinodon variegatus]|uniref:peripheral myelin protein 22-like n=1 Tax=Cyprinodon variegatus TaxID=28743 RepID=UPI0007425062|nr:PREDICTED: peripheral myelin protein 22-like [Cyprinodon variegatus]